MIGVPPGWGGRSMKEEREYAELFNRGVVRNWGEYDNMHPFVRASVSSPSFDVARTREEAAAWHRDLYTSSPAHWSTLKKPEDFRNQ
jgi:hypothetical protein